MEPNCENCYWFWSASNSCQSICHNYMVLSLKNRDIDQYNCEFYDEKHKNISNDDYMGQTWQDGDTK